MELSDLLDSDTLECCEHMTERGTRVLTTYCLLHTTAYRSPWKQHSATNTGARLRNVHLTTTDCTPSLLRACANAPNQPHPSPPAHPPPSRFDQTFRHVKNVTENKVYYRASQVLYGKSITSSGPIRLCDSNELCTKVSWVLLKCQMIVCMNPPFSHSQVS